MQASFTIQRDDANSKREECPRDLKKNTSGFIRRYVPLTLLLSLTLFVGELGFSGTRILFVAGCILVGAIAYRNGGLGLHAEIVISLFAFTPFLRRWVDFHLGYDLAGSMLLGPLLAILAVFSELRIVLTTSPHSMRTLFPQALALLCLSYGWAISAFQGDFLQGSIVVFKYAVPILYSVCLVLQSNQTTGVLRSVARSFVIIGPIIGAYGVVQHVAPQPWDQLWMISSKIDSIGEPVSGKVRVFSTMNSPVSFASYAVCSLLLASMLKEQLKSTAIKLFIIMLPLSLSILLSSVRSAWISVAVSAAICLMRRHTRRKAGFLLLCVGLGIASAVTFAPFRDVIINRVNSLTYNVSNDGSASARLDDYVHVFGSDERYLAGVGFGYNYDREMNALDGLVLSSAVQMGIILGILHVVAVTWAGIQATRFLLSETDTLRTVACALVLGLLSIGFLTAISVGEIGFLYWMFVGLLTNPRLTASHQPLALHRYAECQVDRPDLTLVSPTQFGDG